MLVLARAVAAGHGVAVLPRLSVPDEVSGVRLLELREPRLRRRLSAVARGSVLTRPSVAAVVDAVSLAARGPRKKSDQ
jgi:DNA-binding transcriptional LysR family regulator